MTDLHNDTDGSAELPIRALALHERFLQTLAALFIGLLCVMITISVLSRWAWRSILPDEVQWVQLLMVIIIVGPLAATVAVRESIAVEIFTARARAAALRALAILGHVAGLIFLTFLLWAATALLQKSWASGEYFNGVFEIPNWIGHAIFVACLIVGWLRLAAMIVLDLRPEAPSASPPTP